MIYTFTQEVMCGSLGTNRAVEMLVFVFKYVQELFVGQHGSKEKLVNLQALVQKCGG